MAGDVDGLEPLGKLFQKKAFDDLHSVGFIRGALRTFAKHPPTARAMKVLPNSSGARRAPLRDIRQPLVS